MPLMIQLEYLVNFTTSEKLQYISKTFPNIEILIAGRNFLRKISDINSLKAPAKLMVFT